MLALAGGLFGTWLAGHGQSDGWVLTLAVSGFLATQVLLAGFEPLGQARAGTALLPALRTALTPDARLYAVGLYEQSLTFYLGRPTTLVDYRDEFDFGLQQQPGLAIPTLDAFVREWQANTARGIRSVAIVRVDLVSVLQQRHLRLHVVAIDARRAVIGND